MGLGIGTRHEAHLEKFILHLNFLGTKRRTISFSASCEQLNLHLVGQFGIILASIVQLLGVAKAVATILFNVLGITAW